MRREALVWLVAGAAALFLVACDRSASPSPAMTGTPSPAGPAPSTSPAVVTATPTAPVATATPVPAASVQPTSVVSAPACPPDGFTLAGAAQLAGGAVAITVQVKSKGEACTVSDSLIAGISDRGGVPLLGMAANPATFPVLVVATPAGAVAGRVLWSNWCAAPGTFNVSLAIGAARALVQIGGPPSCTGPSQKSTIGFGP